MNYTPLDIDKLLIRYELRERKNQLIASFLIGTIVIHLLLLISRILIIELSK